MSKPSWQVMTVPDIRLGLVVALRNSDGCSLAGLQLHDDTTIGDAIERAERLISKHPETFQPDTQVVVAHVVLREVEQ